MIDKVQVRTALYQAMDEEMNRDDRVFVIGEEVANYEGAYKVTRDLYKKYNVAGHERVIDTPITEHGFAGLAIGTAMAGLRPVVEFMTFNFALQAIDQIINSAAKTRYMSGGTLSSPIVLRGPNGAASRVAAQHSQCFAAVYAKIPGLKVIAPYYAADAKGLLKAAIRDDNPVIFLENEVAYGHIHDVPDDFNDPDYLVDIGKAKVLQSGSDVTIVSFSIMIPKTLEAVDILAQKGISAEVIDMRTLRPLDIDTVIGSVAKTNRLVVVEEGWGFAGISAEISACVMERAFDFLDAPVARVCGKDVPLPYAANLEKLALPQVDDIVSATLDVCYKS